MKLKKVLTAIEENSIAVLLLVSTGVLFVNVILRYFFKQSTVWAEEFIRYSMIWISFIGSAVCFRKGIHYGIDLILRVKSAAFVRVVKVFIELAGLVFSLFLLRYSWELVMFTKGTGQLSAAMRIPLWTVYLVIPFSALLTALYELVHIAGLISGREEGKGGNFAGDDEEQEVES